MKISEVKSSLARGKYLHTTRTLKCRKFKAISGERNFEKKKEPFLIIFCTYTIHAELPTILTETIAIRWQYNHLIRYLGDLYAPQSIFAQTLALRLIFEAKLGAMFLFLDRFLRSVI